MGLIIPQYENSPSSQRVLKLLQQISIKHYTFLPSKIHPLVCKFNAKVIVLGKDYKGCFDSHVKKKKTLNLHPFFIHLLTPFVRQLTIQVHFYLCTLPPLLVCYPFCIVKNQLEIPNGKFSLVVSNVGAPLTLKFIPQMTHLQHQPSLHDGLDKERVEASQLASKPNKTTFHVVYSLLRM